MDNFNYPKLPFADPDSASDTSSAASVVKLPSLNVGSNRRALRFDLPEDPFNDSEILQPPTTPVVQMFEEGDETFATKRNRWGTTRNKKGNPRREAMNRSKTLKRILRHPGSAAKPSRTPLRVALPHTPDHDSFLDDSLTVIDDYGSEGEEPQEADPKDRKLETRLIVYNRPLPESMADPDTGLPKNDYPRNKIQTAKYTPLTFFPKVLLFQFKNNVANVYFLALIILGFFGIFGVPSPILAAVPLIVILLITAAKESIEDSRRTALDMEVNNQPTHILSQIREAADFSYENVNSNDDSVSIWRRFKKWNTKLLLKFLRMCKRNLTKKGRMTKQEPEPSHHDPGRKSFDSFTDRRKSMHNQRDSTYSQHPRHSMISRKSMTRERTLAFEKKLWKELKVGDVLRVQNNEEIPADILILGLSDDDNCCFVETKNLDGETNLKVKQALKFPSENRRIRRADDLMDLDFEVESEGPHPNLYNYQGCVNYESDGVPKKESTTLNNLILRGCFLRNTKWVIGIVIFTGEDTKIIMNGGITPSKTSRLASELNYYVVINFAILFVICLVSGLVNGFYYRSNENSRDFFEFGTPAGSAALNGLVTFFVAVILYQSLVPISLYITIEIIKSIQAYFIYADVQLYYERLDLPCNPRSWSISDDVGQIEYVFSDKTGTLTQNLMEFRKCTINGQSYGRAYTEAMAGLRKRQGFDVEEEGRIEKAEIEKDKSEMLTQLENSCDNIYTSELTFVSKEFVQDLQGGLNNEQATANHEFMLALALCHSVLVEEDPVDPAKKLLKAQSPDEAALVGTARALGFVFEDKTKRGYIVRVNGEKREYQVLNTLEFNSTRKRMSVIVKLPVASKDEEPKIVLLCKGADLIIYSRLSRHNNRPEMLKKTSKHLEEFATEGLRTLCIGKRELTMSQYQEWNRRHLEASSSLVDREAKMEAVADSIERDLHLIGGTAIEDRLQDGVPEAISILGDAGIKLWVLTGDKVETAINIGFSCNLLGNEMELLILKTELTPEEQKKYNLVGKVDPAVVIESLVSYYLNMFFQMTGSLEELEEERKDHSAPDERYGVVIDGDALKVALANPEVQRKFLLLCKKCKAVLCCRVSPAQKAAVVRMVKDTLDVMTLAIGDGSNDVAMIQAANVGVGIAGEEGRQAAMSSDYALGQFRFLTKLLLTHGRWSYKRFSEMIPLFFLKNVNYTFALFWYLICDNFDGTYMFDFTYLTLYNLIFTSTPVIFLCVFDQDVNSAISMMVPQLYRSGIMQTEFTESKFWIYIIDGFYQSVVSFFFPYLVYYWSFQSANGLPIDHRFFIGVTVTCLSCMSSNFTVLLHQYRWDWLSFLAVSLSSISIFAWTGIYTSLTLSGEFYKAGKIMFGSTTFWSCLFVGLIVCMVPRLLWDIIQRIFFPYDSDIIREQVRFGMFDAYPPDYDPTDPNRGKQLQLQLESKNESAEPIPKLSSFLQSIRRLVLPESFYDEDHIIETYHVRTRDLDQLKQEELDLDSLGEHKASRNRARANNTNSQRISIRTSLELQDMTTARSLDRVLTREHIN